MIWYYIILYNMYVYALDVRIYVCAHRNTSYILRWSLLCPGRPSKDHFWRTCSNANANWWKRKWRRGTTKWMRSRTLSKCLRHTVYILCIYIYIFMYYNIYIYIIPYMPHILDIMLVERLCSAVSWWKTFQGKMPWSAKWMRWWTASLCGLSRKSCHV